MADLIYGSIAGVDGAPVELATGVSTPDIIARGPRLDIRAFGVVGDGSNESAKIQAAIRAASDAGMALYCPPPSVVYGIGEMVEFVGASGLNGDLTIVGDGPELTRFKRLDGAMDTNFFGMFRLDPTKPNLSVVFQGVALDHNYRANPLRLMLTGSPAAFRVGETLTATESGRTVTVETIGPNYLGVRFPAGVTSSYRLEIGHTVVGSTSGASATVAALLTPYSWESTSTVRVADSSNPLRRFAMYDCLLTDPISDSLTLSSSQFIDLDGVRIKDAARSFRNGLTLPGGWGTLNMRGCVWEQQLSFESANSTPTELPCIAEVTGCDLTSVNLAFSRQAARARFRATGSTIRGVLGGGAWDVSFVGCDLLYSKSAQHTGGAYTTTYDNCALYVTKDYAETEAPIVLSNSGKAESRFVGCTFDAHPSAAATFFINAVEVRRRLEVVDSRFLSPTVRPLRFEQRATTYREQRVVFSRNRLYYAPAVETPNIDWANHWNYTPGGLRDPVEIEGNTVHGANATLIAIPPTFNSFVTGNYARLRLKRNKHILPGRALYSAGPSTQHIMPPHGTGERLQIESLDDFEMAAMPTAGWWIQGQRVRNLVPTVQGTAGSRYMVKGWIRLRTGTGHVLGTDWSEERALTGT